MIEVAQSCPSLCEPMDCSLPGSSIHGTFQAIVLEWVAISFSKGPGLTWRCETILAAVLGRVCRDQGWRLRSQQEVQVQAAWTRFVQ